MLTINATVKGSKKISDKVFLFNVSAPEIAHIAKPGQFCNIKVTSNNFPLLRRPFSICDVNGGNITFMIQILGEGTKILSEKCPGEIISIIGPLGNGFSLEGDYDTAVIVAGGLGAAPFPFFLKNISSDKKIICFSGARSASDIISYRLPEVVTSTDDGSTGFKGNIIQCIDSHKQKFNNKHIKLFACGPNAMLKALKEFCILNNYECDVSIESAMACGFGICQGCAIQAADKEGYYLVCKDGPVFNINKIDFSEGVK